MNAGVVGKSHADFEAEQRLLGIVHHQNYSASTPGQNGALQMMRLVMQYVTGSDQTPSRDVKVVADVGVGDMMVQLVEKILLRLIAAASYTAGVGSSNHDRAVLHYR